MSDLEFFEIVANITFGTIWIFLEIAGVFLISRILKFLSQREEVSMVSFLLNPENTFKEIKILFYACSVNFIGFLFSVPHVYFFFQDKPIYFLFGLTTTCIAAIFAFLLIYTLSRWSRRFGKYG